MPSRKLGKIEQTSESEPGFLALQARRAGMTI